MTRALPSIEAHCYRIGEEPNVGLGRQRILARLACGQRGSDSRCTVEEARRKGAWTVIDRSARNETAPLLRQLVAGKITNEEFEDSIPRQSDDGAIAGIADGAWGLYSDTRKYRLTGRDLLSRDTKREVARWVLFLKTDQEYEWPSLPPLLDILLLPIYILTFGLAGRLIQRLLDRGGDTKVWPFRREQDYLDAVSEPPYLAG